MILADGRRKRKKGLDAWIAEQEERRKTVFCYTDIRNEPYSVPE